MSAPILHQRISISCHLNFIIYFFKTARVLQTPTYEFYNKDTKIFLELSQFVAIIFFFLKNHDDDSYKLTRSILYKILVLGKNKNLLNKIKKLHSTTERTVSANDKHFFVVSPKKTVINYKIAIAKVREKNHAVRHKII